MAANGAVTNNRNDASFDFHDQYMPPLVIVRKRKRFCPLRRRLVNYEDFYPAGDCSSGMPPLFLVNKRNHNPLFRIAMENLKAKETGHMKCIQWHPAKIRQGKDRHKNVHRDVRDGAKNTVTGPNDESVSLEITKILNGVFDLVHSPKIEFTPTYNKVGKSLPAITTTLPKVHVPEKMKKQFPICTRKWYYNSPLYHNHPTIPHEMSLRVSLQTERMSVNLPEKPHLYTLKITV